MHPQIASCCSRFTRMPRHLGTRAPLRAKEKTFAAATLLCSFWIYITTSILGLIVWSSRWWFVEVDRCYLILGWFPRNKLGTHPQLISNMYTNGFSVFSGMSGPVMNKQKIITACVWCVLFLLGQHWFGWSLFVRHQCRVWISHDVKYQLHPAKNEQCRGMLQPRRSTRSCDRGLRQLQDVRGW